MQIEQKKWTKQEGWVNISKHPLKKKPQLVFAFGGRTVVSQKKLTDTVMSWYPTAQVVFCSTAGEILDNEVLDDSLSVTAINFEKTKIQAIQADIKNAKQSKEAGAALGKALTKKGLCHVMVFSEGLKINGTELVEGIVSQLPQGVAVTGGLVGDGADFKKTVVGLNQVPASGKLVVIGFYGENIRIGFGSLGGWDTFGPDRIITKSDGNVLYELDNTPALDLYTKYLGDKAEGLPATGLLFPLQIHMPNQQTNEARIVRTILAIDKEKKSLTFAGNIPQGSHAQLMKANFDRLVDGAEGAASMSIKGLGKSKPELAILISCVGRKLVLKSRTEEEIMAVRDIVGKDTAITGFTPMESYALPPQANISANSTIKP
ncbi:MAG: FIST N-terminal domain-containing protein [Patescibacteria group bacterium]